MRLIDGDALTERMATVYTDTDLRAHYTEIMRAIREQPTVDAVPAGCAKCPHWDYSSPCINGNESYCPMLEKYTPADFYCKYGLEEAIPRLLGEGGTGRWIKAEQEE